MNKLNPEELLIKLKSIVFIEDIKIEIIDIDINLDDNIKYCWVNATFNNMLISFPIFLNLIETLGALRYYHLHEYLSDFSKRVIFQNIHHHYKNEYMKWVYNDTGYHIADSFSNLIMNEIDRIQNLFNI